MESDKPLYCIVRRNLSDSLSLCLATVLGRHIVKEHRYDCIGTVLEGIMMSKIKKIQSITKQAANLHVRPLEAAQLNFPLSFGHSPTVPP